MLFYILATFKGGYRLVTVHIHGDLIVLPHWLGDQVVSNKTGFSTQSHNPDSELTSPCTILVILSVMFGTDKYVLF